MGIKATVNLYGIELTASYISIKKIRAELYRDKDGIKKRNITLDYVVRKNKECTESFPSKTHELPGVLEKDFNEGFLNKELMKLWPDAVAVFEEGQS